MTDFGHQQSTKFDKGVVIASIAIKAVVAGGVIYMVAKTTGNVNQSLNRIEFEVGANGRLIATQYHGGRIAKVRYATKAEVWEYSKNALQDQLEQIGIGQ